MRNLLIAAALMACAMLGETAVAADAADSAATSEATALAQRWQAAGNGEAGDPGAALSTLVADGPQVVQDNFPPFVWSGPEAFKAWLGDYVADVAKNQDTETRTTVGAASYARAEGDLVYAVFPVTYTYRKAGAPVRETLTWSFVARQTPGGLKLQSMAYGGGPGPLAVAAAATIPEKTAKAGGFKICGWGMGCH